MMQRWQRRRTGPARTTRLAVGLLALLSAGSAVAAGCSVGSSDTEALGDSVDSATNSVGHTAVARTGFDVPAPTAGQALQGLRRPWIVSQGTEIAKLIGPDSVNKTDQQYVAGADLGSMFRFQGKTYFVFGDSFGEREPGMTGGGGEGWRSNLLAFSTDTDPSDGITFDGFVVDENGQAKELLPGKKIDYDEMTIIPTYGFAVDSTMYLAFMSVQHWGEPGEWTLNKSGLAKSTDNGQNWTPIDNAVWPGDTNFGQLSVARVDDDLYVWGVPGGRFGGVKLAVVPAAEVENLKAWKYFAGLDNAGQAQWVSAETDATNVVVPTVGELSVVWNRGISQWMMSYTDAQNNQASLRFAPAPWGPWSEPQKLISGVTVPGQYSPYLLPEFISDDGTQFYFTLSQWDPYSVFWYRASLSPAGS